MCISICVWYTLAGYLHICFRVCYTLPYLTSSTVPIAATLCHRDPLLYCMWHWWIWYIFLHYIQNDHAVIHSMPVACVSIPHLDLSYIEPLTSLRKLTHTWTHLLQACRDLLLSMLPHRTSDLAAAHAAHPHAETDFWRLGLRRDGGQPLVIHEVPISHTCTGCWLGARGHDQWLTKFTKPWSTNDGQWPNQLSLGVGWSTNFAMIHPSWTDDQPIINHPKPSFPPLG